MPNRASTVQGFGVPAQNGSLNRGAVRRDVVLQRAPCVEPVLQRENVLRVGELHLVLRPVAGPRMAIEARGGIRVVGVVRLQ